MSRLTEKKYIDGLEFYTNEGTTPWECIQRLGLYEDLEEAGRLIELPCKVGDTVWIIYTDDMTVRPQKISEIRFLEKHDILTFENGTSFAIWRKRWNRFIDRYIFLTKAETEAKLAELKEGTKCVEQ